MVVYKVACREYLVEERERRKMRQRKKQEREG